MGWPYQGDPKGEFFTSHVQLHGGLAPVRRILPDLIWSQKINPGKVFDLTLPLEQVAEGYRAMDEWHNQGTAVPLGREHIKSGLV